MQIQTLKCGIFFLIALILIFVFARYGRSIYMPVLKNIKGKESVESRIQQIEPNARERLEKYLEAVGFKMDYPQEIILAAFKEERVLQVYTRRKNDFVCIKAYPFTGYSGTLGPKLKKGDRQIPEGIYVVEYLNPNSSYYLSIKVSYPNAFDLTKSTLSDPEEMGGDIFIHGKSSTVGCIPVGDEAIEELFLLTQKAINNGVKVIISPRDFRLNDTSPQIDAIDWEEELYDMINAQLMELPLPIREGLSR